jgi:hypothetical protein
MKVIAVVCVVVALWPVAAFAGNIFGTIFENHQPVKGVEVTIVCGSNNYQARTGADGSYSLRADEPGRCMLKAAYKNQTAEMEIFSYAQPTRYDFELVMTNGKYALKKK